MKAYFTTEEEREHIKSLCEHSDVNVTMQEFPTGWDIIAFEKDGIHIDVTVPDRLSWNLEFDIYQENVWSDQKFTSLTFNDLNTFDKVYGLVKSVFIYLYNNRSSNEES